MKSNSEFLLFIAELLDEPSRFGGGLAKGEIARLRSIAVWHANHARSESTRTSHVPGDKLDAIGPGVVLRMSEPRAKELSHGLSDILCWCRGFVAACPDDLERHPINWETAREINIALRSAIEEAEKETQA